MLYYIQLLLQREISLVESFNVSEGNYKVSSRWQKKRGKLGEDELYAPMLLFPGCRVHARQFVRRDFCRITQIQSLEKMIDHSRRMGRETEEESRCPTYDVPASKNLRTNEDLREGSVFPGTNLPPFKQL